jgi:hypothetical protein
MYFCCELPWRIDNRRSECITEYLEIEHTNTVTKCCQEKWQGCQYIEAKGCARYKLINVVSWQYKLFKPTEFI